MMPKAGGQYAYLKEIFGPLTAFLYAWVTFVVINGSGIAALSLTFAKYTAFVFPMSNTGTSSWARRRSPSWPSSTSWARSFPT